MTAMSRKPWRAKVLFRAKSYKFIDLLNLGLNLDKAVAPYKTVVRHKDISSRGAVYMKPLSNAELVRLMARLAED